MQEPAVEKSRLRQLLRGFAGRRVLVVGDAIVDQYVWGEPARVSREAPVLILHYREETTRPGGAANAASNLRALGGLPTLVSLTGADDHARRLETMLRANAVNTLLVPDSSRPTPTKIRLMAGYRQGMKQQVVRLDRVDEKSPTEKISRQILQTAIEALPKVEAVIISDYGLGTLTDAIIPELVAACRQRGILVAADSRYNLSQYVGVDVATPNIEEAEGVWGNRIRRGDDVIAAGLAIQERLGGLLVLTQGEDGMTVFESPAHLTHIPAVSPAEVFDVTGAGDTVIATLVLGLLAGASPVEAAVLANLAAGLVVRKAGAASVNRTEILKAMSGWHPLVMPLVPAAAAKPAEQVRHG